MDQIFADLLNTFLSGLLLGSVYGLIGVGLAFIWGIMNVCNFAQGDFSMWGAFITYFLFMLFGIDPMLAIPVIFIILFGMGLLAHKGIVEHIFQEGFGIQVFTTFGLLLMVRYGGLVVFGINSRNLPSYLPWARSLYFGAIRISITGFISIILGLAALLALHLFLNKTWIGTAMLATTSNREAAQLMGIDVERIYLLAFGIGVAISGIGGILIAINYPIYPTTTGALFTLIAFVVVVLGGLGSLHGAFIGGLIIGVIQKLSSFFLPGTLQNAVAFTVFLVVLIVKPSGLFRPIGAAYKKMTGE